MTAVTVESLSLAAVGLAFLAGLLSFLSPCVLPLLPVYLSYVSGVGVDRLQGRRGRVVGPALLFVAGCVTMGVAHELATGHSRWFLPGAGVAGAMLIYGMLYSRRLDLRNAASVSKAAAREASFLLPLERIDEMKVVPEGGRGGVMSLQIHFGDESGQPCVLLVMPRPPAWGTVWSFPAREWLSAIGCEK